MTKQGSPLQNGHAPDLDLDAELDAIDLSPVPVKLGGVTYMVRRDLTAKEQAQYWELVRKQKDQAALAILVGDDAVSLNATLESLPRQKMERAAQQIMVKAGLAVEAGATGEFKAS